MAFFDPIKQLPGYREAIEAEVEEWDTAFLGLTETINGVEVLPFRPNHFLILSRIKSTFLCGGDPSPAEVARFLWVVSPGFTPGNSVRARWRRRRFTARCRRLQWLATAKAIYSYIESAIPTTGRGKFTRSYYSCGAAIVDRFASEYGWPASISLNLPFKQIFQLYRCQDRRADPKAAFTTRADLMVVEHTRQKNEALKRN